MKITVKGKSNERVKVTSDKRKDEVEQVLLEIRKMCRNLNKLLKKEFEIELTISSEDIAYREDWISYKGGELSGKTKRNRFSKSHSSN